MLKVFFLLAFFTCLVPIYCGKVRPYGAHSIVLTSTNAGDLADYNFTMTLDTDLPAGGLIEITFPYNQYLAGLGLPYNFVVYAPYPTVITATLDSTTATTIICQVGQRVANTSFTIGVLNVRNPSKTGGTGNFKVLSRIGNKILDVNYNFGVIGIYAASSDLLSASITFEGGMSQLAGQLTSYVLTFTPSVNLPSLIDIKVVFPEIYDLSSLQASQCSEYKKTLGFNLYCQTSSELPNVVIFQNFSASIAQGTSVNLLLQNVTNPAQEMTTKSLSYFVREKGTNNTIQKSTGVPGLYINPGTVYSVQLSNSNPYFPLYSNLNRELLLSFRPSNPFNAIQIGTAFPLISSCSVVNGLSLKDDYHPIVCSASSGVMVIKGFKTYDPEDLYLKVVTIKLLATLPSTNILTNHIEIYTFLDEGYLYKVDQSTTADTTQAQIVTLTTTRSLATTALTTTSTVPEAANTFTFAIQPAASYATVTSLVFELSRDFTGIPSCTYRLADGASYSSKACTLKNGIMTMAINAALNTPTTTPASVVITGLKNPTIPKTYYIRYYVKTSATTISEHYLVSTTLTSPTISTISMVPIAHGANHNTFYALTLQTVSFLQDGYFLLAEPNKLSSYIDITFNMQTGGSTSYTNTLGSSLNDRADYPCEIIGMKSSVFTTNARCILLKGPAVTTATSTVTVRVLDFNFVLTGTTIRINIPLLNSQLSSGNPQVTVQTYIVKSYQTYLTSQASLTLATPVASLGSGGTMTSISLTNSSVQANTTLTMSFSTTTAITAGSNSSIQIEYPSGFIFLPSTITVTLDGTAVAANKLHFAAAFNLFTIELASNLAASSHTIIVNLMSTPNASFAAGNFYLRTAQSSAYANAITFTMPTLTPGAFSTATPTMAIYPDQYSHPYALYSFNLTTSKYIPSTASIVITFPAAYTLNAYAECTSLLGLNASTSTGLQCIVAANTITIKNFKDISIGTALEIAIFGITNPGSSISASFFVIRALDASSNTLETVSLSSSLTGTFAAFDLNVTVARMTPRNPVVDSAFLFTVDPGKQIPKGSIMTVNFDSAFSILYSETIDLVECIAQGGLYVISDCSVSGVVLTMTMGATSNASVPIDYHYFGLLRFPNANQALTGFTVTLTYKGSTIASAATFPSITSSGTVTPLSPVTMDFYPRNEGEKANYLFTFTPATTLLDETMYFLIRFPSVYDPQLFKWDPVVESSQLTGALVATVMSRQIIVTGFKSMTVTGPITLRLWGVVNPNKVDITRTGTFSLALMQDDDVLEGNFAIPGIIPYLAPESIQFTSLTSKTTNSRYSSDFTFTFSSTKAIPDSDLGGQLFVDFPPDYLIDSYDGGCGINEDFSFFVNCYLDNNRVFVNASNSQWTETMGSLTLEVDGIRTPDDDGEALNFIIFNYDSSDKRILSRTYSTLNSGSIVYTYDGILISVNDDEPVDVEVGTYTDLITIKLPSPSLQTLTLTPNTLNSTITIAPFPLTIELGETEVSFRVAAPRDILLKSFYITWSKTGDSLIPTYANLRRTNLRMRSGYVKRVVSYESMEYIPAGGITFPLLISTPNPPYTELNVTLSILNGDTLATLSRSILTFAKGDFNQKYNLTVDLAHPLTNVQVFCALGGYDGPSYILDSDTLTIPIIAEETFLPVISSGFIEKTTRSSVTFNVTANTLSFIYFVIGYKNMPVANFTEVKWKLDNISVPVLNYSKPIFSEDYIKRSPKNISITVNDLSPGRDYEIYAYVMNLNQVANPAYLKLSFSTKAPQYTAEFVMQIKQTLLPSDLKNEIVSRLAQMISIDAGRLIERTSTCYQTRDSLYFNAPNSSYFHLYLIPDPTNENDNSAPINLVRNLNTRTNEIKEFVPRLADGDLLQIQPLVDAVPDFTVRPSYVSNEYYSLTMSVTVGACGYIHAIAIPVPLSQNNTPTQATVYKSEAPLATYPYSFEIFSQLDIQNQPALYQKVRVADFSKDYTLTISVPTDNLIYRVYITTENDWPIYNLFMPDNDVARIEAKTIKKRKPLNVYSINYDDYSKDTSAPKQALSVISLLVTLLIIIFI